MSRRPQHLAIKHSRKANVSGKLCLSHCLFFKISARQRFAADNKRRGKLQLRLLFKMPLDRLPFREGAIADLVQWIRFFKDEAVLCNQAILRNLEMLGC